MTVPVLVLMSELSVFTVDPGATMGLAYFQKGSLLWNSHCTFEKAFEEIERFTNAYHIDVAVLECPRVYPKQRAKANANDLIVLARKVGALEQFFRSKDVPVEIIFPSDWKGQVEKTISHNRIRKKATPAELALLSKNHNGLDAAGMGLWKLGRYR